MAIAVATPAMLPVPMVAEREVISALKPEISPSPFALRPDHNKEKPFLIFSKG